MRRVWSEDLSYEAVAGPRSIDLLSRAPVDLIVAVRPWQVDALPRLARALSDARVPMAIWPMLEDSEGRWASARTLPAFVAFCARVLGVLDGHHLTPKELVVDLEPPIAVVRALLGGKVGELRRLRRRDGRRHDFDEARQRMIRFVDSVKARGIAVSAAAVPIVALDDASSDGWQRLLGTPVVGPSWDHVSLMVYPSLLCGWSRGLFRRRDAHAFIRDFARAGRRLWGDRAGLSLGLVGTGALGDEPIHGTAAELAEDVAAAEACGIEHLSLFDLRGVLARSNPASWIDAFVRTESAPSLPRATRRSSLALWAAGVAGPAAAALLASGAFAKGGR